MAAESEFGAELRRLRTLRGLSLAELSRLTHYSKGYLSNVENGHKPATTDLAHRLDEVLGCHGSLISLADAEQISACPYLGLAAFGPADTRWFFGRERTSAALASRVAEGITHGLPLVVFGASGAGKSSVLRAGLVPALARSVLPARGSAKWPVLVMTPTSNPAKALCEGAAKLLGVPVPDLRDSLGDGSWQRALRTALGPGGTRLVIVVDQFEEVFTLCEDEAERAQFIAALCGRSDTALVVLGVRADFYVRCLAYPELLNAVQNNQFVVDSMTDAELAEAVTGPARTAKLELEPGLVEVLLRDLGLARGDRPGTLPLLSHALLTTWQQRSGDRMTLAGYQLTGGIHGAVAATAERVYTSLDDEGRRAVRRILLRLVHVGEDEDTRRRRDRDRLVGDDAGVAALQALAAARLLTLDRDSVEITHEALLWAWPRLREWIEADRAGLRVHQLLSEAAESWERSHDRLYRGAALANAKEWAAQHPDELTAVEREFLETSDREEQRGPRRLRRLLVGFVALSVVAALAAGAALWAGAKEREQRNLALAQKVVAETPALHAVDPGLALQLSLAAYRLAPDAETRSGLLSAIGSAHFTRLDHPDTVTSVSFSPDGHTLATTDEDANVRLWQTAGPAQPRVLSGHTGVVTSSAFRPDGRVLATGGEDGSVRLWDLGDHDRPLAVLRLAKPVRSLGFSPDGQLLGTSDGRLWDVSEPRRPSQLGTVAGATAIVFSPDRHTVATTDGLWSIADPHRPELLAPLEQTVGAPVFGPDGRILATDGHLWDVSSPGRPVALGTLAAHTSAAFSPDGRTLALGGADRTVVLTDVTNPGQPSTLAVLTGHTEVVTAVAFSPDGRSLATGSDDNTVRLWRLPVPDLAGHTDRVMSTAFTPDGRVLVSASLDRTLRVWDTADLTRPHLLATLVQPARVRSVAVRGDGRLLAVGDDLGTITLWDLNDPRQPVTAGVLTGHAGWVRSIAFSQDGRTLVSGSEDHSARLWDVSDPSKPVVLSTLDGHSDRVMSVAFSRDGHTLATGGYDRTVRLWDASDPRHPTSIATLTDHTHVVRAVAFSPDGRTLATGSWDRTSRLWDVTDPRQPRGLATLAGHTGAVNAVIFSPDGKTLATAGDDGAVRLWDVGNPAEPRTRAILTGHTDLVYALAFHPDGHTLASAGRDRDIRLWETDPELAAARACDLAGPRVTEAQWTAGFGDYPYQPPCP